MTTSGSVNYDESATQIIKDALILVGGLEDDETPTADQEQYAMRMLNRLVKAWSRKGLKAWVWKEITLNLVASQTSYTLGPATADLVTNRPVEIANARRVVDSVETEIQIRSRNEYMNQPSKDSEGKPVYVYYDPQLTRGVLYVWPAPDDTDQIKLSSKSYIEDFDSLADTPYFPPEWLLALVYNLALLLMPKYEVTGEDAVRITNLALKFLDEAETNDTDDGSVFLMPERVY
jgi:hypothetical protein